jgi:hypothetical protein
MEDADPELARLMAAEEAHHLRYLRLSRPNGWPTDSDVLKAARKLWVEATAAVRVHRNAREASLLLILSRNAYSDGNGGH